MTPGTFLHDPNFRFKGGKTGNKIFVILNYGSSGYCIAVKTNSQDARYERHFGCQATDRFPSFYLPPNACPFLNKDTWIQIDSFYEFDHDKLNKRIHNSEIFQTGILDLDITLKLLDCVILAEDITQAQEEEIFAARRILKNSV